MKKTVIICILVIVALLSGCGNASSGSIKSDHKDISEPVVTENDSFKGNSNDDITSDVKESATKESVANEPSTKKPSEEQQKVIGDTHSVTDQLKIIASHIDLWASPADYANDVYNYAVTDLDKNGRLEIIASNCGGTGYYTYSKFYEINKDYNGLIACEYLTHEDDSQADIAVESVSGYYDPQKDIMYYIFDDFLKSSAAEFDENKRAVYLKDGSIKEILLAYKTTKYTDSSSSETTCMDKDQKQISEEEYETIADSIFAGMEKKRVSLGWCDFSQPDELKNMSEKELIDMLTKSSEKFAIE